MKMKVIRIDSVNRSGTSKTGNPYHIDQTEVTVEVAMSTPTGFGFKEMTYQFGDSTKIKQLEHLRGRLPVECDIELGVVLNDYGSTQTVAVDVRAPQLAKAQ